MVYHPKEVDQWGNGGIQDHSTRGKRTRREDEKKTRGGENIGASGVVWGLIELTRKEKSPNLRQSLTDKL